MKHKFIFKLFGNVPVLAQVGRISTNPERRKGRRLPVVSSPIHYTACIQIIAVVKFGLAIQIILYTVFIIIICKTGAMAAVSKLYDRAVRSELPVCN